MAESTCNMPRIDVSEARMSVAKLAEILWPMRQPVIIRGFLREHSNQQDPCNSILGIQDGRCAEGTMRVRLASPSALAEFGPLRAAGQSWNGRLADHNMSLRQYVRAWFDTDRRSELPPDAYCFVDVAASDGLAMRQARLRAAFSETCRQLAANAPSTTPDGSRFRVEDLGRQTRMRLLAGPIGTGTGWHNHGPALAALLETQRDAKLAAQLTPQHASQLVAEMVCMDRARFRGGQLRLEASQER